MQEMRLSDRKQGGRTRSKSRTGLEESSEHRPSVSIPLCSTPELAERGRSRPGGKRSEVSDEREERERRGRTM